MTTDTTIPTFRDTIPAREVTPGMLLDAEPFAGQWDPDSTWRAARYFQDLATIEGALVTSVSADADGSSTRVTFENFPPITLPDTTPVTVLDQL